MATTCPAAVISNRIRSGSAGGRDRAQADEDPPGGVPDGLPPPPQHPADRPARKCIRAVAQQAEADPAEAEDDRLRPHRPVWVDELGQEGEEEERRLRVQDVDDDALAEDAAAAPGGALLGLDRVVLAEQLADPDVDEIG